MFGKRNILVHIGAYRKAISCQYVTKNVSTDTGIEKKKNNMAITGTDCFSPACCHQDQ